MSNISCGTTMHWTIAFIILRTRNNHEHYYRPCTKYDGRYIFSLSIHMKQGRRREGEGKEGVPRGQDRGTPPTPSVPSHWPSLPSSSSPSQGQDSCAVRAVCLLLSCRRTFSFLNISVNETINSKPELQSVRIDVVGPFFAGQWIIL